MIEGWYYLHTNGELIYKRELGDTAADIRESDFCRAMWPMDPTDREGAWNIIVEASALDGSYARIKELAAKWGCDDADALNYAERLGIILEPDGDRWCAKCSDFTDLVESPAGFGLTCLDAMSALCKALGYRGGKMWNHTFKSLTQRQGAIA